MGALLGTGVVIVVGTGVGIIGTGVEVGDVIISVLGCATGGK